MKLHNMLAFALAASFVAGPAAAEMGSHLIKVSNGAAKTHPVSAGIDAMTACLKDGSGGKIKVRGFYSGALGDDMEATQAVRAGSIEMVVTGSAAIGGIEPAMNVFGLPFLFASEEEVDAVLTGPFYDYIKAKMPQHDLILLSFWENGFRNTTNSKRPIKAIGDFEGLNFRVMQNNIFLDTFRQLGTNPVPIAFGEVFTALETGAVDGQENPLSLIEASKFYEVQKYLTLTRHAYSPLPALFSKKVWDTYSPEAQALVQKCTDLGRVAQIKRSRDANAANLAILKKLGMQVSTLSDAEMAKLRVLVKPVYTNNIGAIGQETFDRMMVALDAQRKH